MARSSPRNRDAHAQDRALLETALDDELEGTFPASDPPGLTQPHPHPRRDLAIEDLDEA